MTPADELSCQELVAIVTDYLEGRLAPEDQTRFENHVLVCGGCSNYLEQMRLTVELTGRLTKDDLSPETVGELLNAFRGWQRA